MSKESFAGRVTIWKGTYGWIEPLEPIEHSDISRHNGKIFVHMEDLAYGKKILRVGVICEFHLYSDGEGLGAENVISRQVVRILLPTSDGKRIFSENGEGVPAFEDRHNVSLRGFEWYNSDGTLGVLPFLIEFWGRPDALILAIKEVHESVPILDFLIPQSRLWLLDLEKMRQTSSADLQLSQLTAIDDPMPCFPLKMLGTGEQVGLAVGSLIDQICDQ